MGRVKATNVIYFISLFLGVICNTSATPVNITQPVTVTNDTSTHPPCPCDNQPAGIVIAHPTDCRGYMTCLDSSSVRYSKCGARDELFHPYLRTCVQRSRYASFIPSIILTKDLCKIPSLFRTASPPENFENCRVIFDDNFLPDSQSDEDIFPSSNEQPSYPHASSSGDFNNRNKLNDTLLTAWKSIMNFGKSAPSDSLRPVSSTPVTTTSTMTPHQSKECRITRIIVQHFPAPCQANITCANGISFSITNCQNTLNFQSF